MNKQDAARGAGLLVVYFAAGWLGLQATSIHASASPVWPPTGIALAALVLWGRRFAPVVLVGASAFNLLNAPALGVALQDPAHILTSFAIGFGNMLEAVVGAYLIQRWCGNQPFRDAPRVGRFTAAAMLCSAVSASVGTGVLVAAGFAPLAAASSIWTTWWLGDAGGALLLTPFILLWSHPRWSRELAYALGAILVTGAVAAMPLPTAAQAVVLLAMVTLLAWPAGRLGPHGATAGTLAVSIIVVGSALVGRSPFTALGPNVAVLLVQITVVVAASLALLMSVPWRSGATMPGVGRSSTLLALAVMSPLVLASAGAGLLTANLTTDLQADRYDAHREAVMGAVEEGVQIDALQLASLATTHEVVGGLSRSAFHAYVDHRQWLEEIPGVQAVAFLEAVPTEGLEELAERERNDPTAAAMGYPEFVVHPEADVPLHYVVVHITPIESNAAAYGLDLAFNATRMEAVQAAITTNESTATAPIHLIQAGTPRPAFLLVHPVWQEGRVVGLVDTVHTTEELVRDALVGLDANVSLRDIGPAGTPLADGGTLLYGNVTDGSPWLQFDVAGRSWALAVEQRDFLSPTERAAPWFLLVAGGAFSILLLVVGYLNAATVDRARNIADALTTELKRSNADLEQFAFAASHDLRQPLEAVDGYLEEAEAATGEARAAHLASARISVQRMRELLRAILAYAQTGSDVQTRPVLLRRMFTRLLEGMADQDVRVEGTGTVWGDEALLTTLFRNIIQNGLKFHRPGEIPRVRVTIDANATGTTVRIRDYGIGIPDGSKAEVFALFRRLHTRGEYEGTGLGLAMVKRIADLHGATVTVIDAAPGSVFVVWFPPRK